MKTSTGSNKRQRDIQRIIHLIAGVALMAYIYTPLGSTLSFTALMQFLIVPLVVVTGMLMWQLPKLRKLLQGSRQAHKGREGTS